MNLRVYIKRVVTYRLETIDNPKNGQTNFNGRYRIYSLHTHMLYIYAYTCINRYMCQYIHVYNCEYNCSLLIDLNSTVYCRVTHLYTYRAALDSATQSLYGQDSKICFFFFFYHHLSPQIRVQVIN